MARGWESKSVEEQQAEAISTRSGSKRVQSPQEIARDREKQGLMLSRKRLLQQLSAAQNPRHREMLERALADLDAKLTRLS